ncbi:MAG TPA: ABC transporter ATP-binding protein, partial [Thermoanaerobaculia bacterium]|nr:ABC transporter ATP-binding protein [Thermoanaerobaculia bacterium]
MLATVIRRGGVVALVAGFLLVAPPSRALPAPDAREVAAGLAALGPRADPATRGRARVFLLD